jgi:hypothetical protein
MLECINCKPNASLRLGICTCDAGYYVSADNLRECIPFAGLCNECYEIYEE